MNINPLYTKLHAMEAIYALVEYEEIQVNNILFEHN